VANSEKGEVDARFGDQIYTLKLATNALCIAETVTGESAVDLLLAVRATEAFKFTAIRAVLYAALQEKHAKRFPTVESVAGLIDDMGIAETRNVLARAIEASYPPPKEEDTREMGDGEHPMTADRANLPIGRI